MPLVISVAGLVSFHIKILILTLVLLVGGLMSYSLVKNGYFPVVRVDGKLISYHTIKENIEVARRLHQSGLAGNSPEMDVLLSRDHGPELVKGALESVITNAVIKTSASQDVQAQAWSEIDSNFSGAGAAKSGLADSIRTVYGWDLDEFKQRVLEPQALRQILTQEKGQDNFNDWLNDAKSKATVSIWFLPFEWKGGKLENRI